MKNLPVTIVFNQPGDAQSSVWGNESDNDTYDCVVEIKQVLKSGGYKVSELPIRRDEMSGIKKIKHGIIFNLVEWTGKDMKYTKKAMDLIEKTGLPYTGSDFKGLFLSTDKVLMKNEFIRLGIPTPKYQIFKTENDPVRPDFNYPVIVKPAYEHCGIGITQESVLENTKDLKRKVTEFLNFYQQPILAEEYIEGREIAVTVLEDKLRPRVLAPVEVAFTGCGDGRPIYTYETKWQDKGSEFNGVRVSLAQLPERVGKRIDSIAKRVYMHLGGRDYPRLDIRLRGEEIFVLEVNNNPEIDFTFQGSLRVGVESAGMSYIQFLEHVMRNVIYRFSVAGYARAEV